MVRLFTGFILGVVLAGAVFFYFALTDAQKIEHLTKKVQEWKKRCGYVEEQLKRMLEEVKGKEQALKSMLTRFARVKEEKQSLQDELERLKKQLATKQPQQSIRSPGSSASQKEVDPNAGKLRQLLEKLALNPADLETLSAIMDVVWRVKDAKLLKDTVERLSALAKAQEEREGKTALTCYMQSVLCGARMAALQTQMKKDPSKGALLGARMGELSMEGLKWLDEAVKLDPKEPRYRLTRGWWRLYNPGTAEKALEDFRWIVNASKKERLDNALLQQAYAGLVLSLRRTGKKGEAEQALQEALNLFPDSQLLLKLKK